MKYGYARCSTNEIRQDINRQKRELYELGVKEENIYFEYESGIKDDRVELNKLMKIIKPGDEIYTTEVSRLTRSTKKLCELIKEIEEKEIKLVIKNSMTIDCRNKCIDPMSKGMILLMGVIGELERDITSQRIKSGLINARAKGHKIGRPPLTLNTMPKNFKKHYYLYKEGKISVNELSFLCKVAKSSAYKYIHLLEKDE